MFFVSCVGGDFKLNRLVNCLWLFCFLVVCVVYLEVISIFRIGGELELFMVTFFGVGVGVVVVYSYEGVIFILK